MVSGNASRRVRLMAVAVSLFALSLSFTGGAAAAPPTNANIVITSVTDQADPSITTAIAGQPFDVAVELRDNAGNLYAVNNDTTISLNVSGGTANLQGNTTGTIPKGASATTIQGSIYPKVENVTLKASGFKLATGEWFLSVQKQAVGIAPSTQPLTVTTCGPGDPSSSNPICAEVTFHNGTGGASGWFGVAACRNFNVDTGRCLVDVSLFSAIIDLPSGLYTQTDPLKVLWKCDKSVCETGKKGPSSGVPFNTLFVQLVDGEPFVPSPACPSKGTIGEDQQFCTDYVESNRSAGDLILPVLFAIDWRMR